MTLQRKRVLKDGTSEIQEPHIFEGGKYRVLIEVDTISEVEKLFDSGMAVSMRMSAPGKKNPSLVRPDK
ncbi:hypothetical protein [Hyphomonas oceanitis]|uniref:hypothetical protein n=1 Tax=Hyphomonas oceanitis TaxID=81033 RepID=UPI003001832B